ncbi:gliding motility-associated C-terminal domain-containing protein [Mucilaginibacter yixingensis]|nr:gliding motility-associated C-terminal domain-containing protein [Mucilaginibacter yixingensis]
MLVNTKGVELYGFYIRDFNAKIEEYKYTAGIFMENSEDVQIGAFGKNNVFSHNYSSIANTASPLKSGGGLTLSVNNLKVYANIFGFEPDGKTARNYDNFQSFDNIYLNCWQGNIEIGGNDISQRNFFGYGATIINYGTQPNNIATITIKNNYFNYDIDGLPKPRTGGPNKGSASSIKVALDYGQDDSFFYPYTVNVTNNKMVYPSDIYIGLISGDLNFKGNIIANELGSAENYGTHVQLKSKANILIGGENIGEGNSIYNQPLWLYSTKSVELHRNSLFCVGDTFGPWLYTAPNIGQPVLPEISIIQITPTTISGKATPLSKIEVFDDGGCMRCEPYTYITTTTADANGNWSCNGSISNGAIASATINGFTSYFTKAAWYEGGKKIHYSCTEGGSVKSTVIHNGTYEWRDPAGNIIGTTPEITGLTPGNYTLKVLNGISCSSQIYTFRIIDSKPILNESDKHIVQPSCNIKGSITGLSLVNTDATNDAYYQGQFNIYTYKWVDATGSVKSNTIDLTNADAGTYQLQITYNQGCTTTFGPFVLTNSTGPSLNQTTAIITPTPCGQSTGSITGIIPTGTGNLRYSWKNGQGNEVATTKDLTGQPAGVYTLTLTDDTQCGPVSTTAIPIPETNGITLNDNGIATSPDCAGGKSSITGITVTGATNYQWINTTQSRTYSSATPDITDLPPGTYHLMAFNGNGCSKISKDYIITAAGNTENYGGLTKVLTPATCGQNNGIIEAIFMPNNQPMVTPKSVRWVQKSTGIEVGHSMKLEGIDAGTYSLYATGQNGCERFLIDYSITRTPGISVSGGSVTDDNCNSGSGSISGVSVSGGIASSVQWTDASGKTVGTQLDLTGVYAGTYLLKVTGSGCSVPLPFTVGNADGFIAAPAANNLQLCSAGDALLTAGYPATGSGYRLYSDAVSTTLLDQQTSGKFKIRVSADRSYYVSRYKGNCESARTEIKVSLGIGALTIANAFTPNGDGVNDTWAIKGAEAYPNGTVQVFTRGGDKIFESKGYAHPFDGSYNGQPLPSGTYYYIINFNTSCGLLSGSLTIIR